MIGEIISSALGSSAGFGGGLVVSKLIDYFAPFKSSPQGKLFQKQRELQKELEAERMSFQERLEDKRLNFQARVEEKRAELQKYLVGKQLDANREIALFQARAMRQTQMLLAHESARLALQSQLFQDALRSFPLNVSPLVLLENQSKTLNHLTSFLESSDSTSLELVYEEVEASRKQPEALNIFVAPVHVDSKIKNRKVLSDQIWDTVYQKIESFFTLNYNRSGEHPVIFYPTAWNDRYNPGMHASETLHFFLKDLPCIVIEPRFDGNKFRMMFSTWGLGYNSSLHHRTELSFDINIDTILACSVYERSVKALKAIAEIEKLLDSNQLGFASKKRELETNIDLFQALHIEDRIKEKRMDEIDALGIYNIFKIEPTQDLTKLADYLSARIGLNLAVLADIHHLRSYDKEPILPKLLKPYFPEIFNDKVVIEQLLKEYEDSFNWLRKEEFEFHGMKEIRQLQLANIKKELCLSDSNEVMESITETICKYVNTNFLMETTSIEDAINQSIGLWENKDIPFFQSILKNDKIELDRRIRRRIDSKLFDLLQN